MIIGNCSGKLLRQAQDALVRKQKAPRSIHRPREAPLMSVPQICYFFAPKYAWNMYAIVDKDVTFPRCDMV